MTFAYLAGLDAARRVGTGRGGSERSAATPPLDSVDCRQ